MTDVAVFIILLLASTQESKNPFERERERERFQIAMSYLFYRYGHSFENRAGWSDPIQLEPIIKCSMET